MPTPFTTSIPAYDFRELDISQGAILGFYGGYAANLGEPVGGWTPLGMFEPAGFSFADKPTFAETSIDQALQAVTAFVTKRETDIKFTLSHILPEARNFLYGYAPASLTVTPGTDTTFGTKQQNLGDFADIGNGGATIVAGGGDDPSNEVVPRQVLFLFLSPGFNFTTTPRGKWAYVRFPKAYAHSPLELTHGKEKRAMIGATLRSLHDFSVSNPQQACGEVFTFTPKVP